MGEAPEISVIITCFNYGHYVEGCLNSVMAQTYDNYEIIFIDDGSTDDTPQVMQKFSGLPNLHYIRQENAGQANAKNRGIQEARGRYIAFLDADDLWVKDKLEKQIRLFENPSIGVVYSRSSYIDLKGHFLDFKLTGKYLQPRSGEVSNWLFIDNFVPFSSSVVRAECFDKLGTFDETLKMGIDWDLWLRFSTMFEFDFVDEPLLLYRMGHPGQMSRNSEVRQECADRIMKKFLNKNHSTIDAFFIREAYSYTFCNRGNYFRKIDKKKSFVFFLKAIKEQPFNRSAYRGLVKNLISSG